MRLEALDTIGRKPTAPSRASMVPQRRGNPPLEEETWGRAALQRASPAWTACGEKENEKMERMRRSGGCREARVSCRVDVPVLEKVTNGKANNSIQYDRLLCK